MKSTAVRLDSLTKRYEGKAAVDNVSLHIAPGSMVALLGPSGCGKTTCLRMIAGLVQPTVGEIYVNDRNITHIPVHRRNIGMLFQNYALFPHLSVAQNVAFGLQMRGVNAGDIGTRVNQALSLVQLAHMGERLPSQLSGGQQQRVALARALVIEPSMLLLDEPLGALDKGLRESMQVELRGLQQRLGLTTVMVTHDQDEALTMADTIVVMRDGKLEQVGSAAEIYQRPATEFVANFIGASNMFSGQVERSNGEALEIKTGSGIRLRVNGTAPGASTNATVSVRPEAIAIERSNAGEGGDSFNTVRAQVDEIVYRGFISHYYLRLSDGQQMVVFRQNQGSDGAPAYAKGDHVIARWNTSSNHLLSGG